MSYLIVAEDSIGVLSNANLPAAVGGGPNPFKDLIEFLDKTRGRWNHQSEARGGRAKFESMVRNESGAVIPGGGTIYQSPYFSANRLPIETVPQAMALFGAIGLYFELIQYPCFVQIADQQYDNQTPSYLPNSRITEYDEEGEPTGVVTKVTWDNWKDATHQHVSDGGENYIPLNSNTRSNELAGSMLSALIADGFTVKPMSQWPVIAADEPE